MTFDRTPVVLPVWLSRSSFVAFSFVFSFSSSPVPWHFLLPQLLPTLERRNRDLRIS